MTVERQYGKIIFTCDVEQSARCEEQIETGETDFTAALAEAKQDGWTVHRKADGGYMHCCPRCPVPR